MPRVTGGEAKCVSNILFLCLWDFSRSLSSLVSRSIYRYPIVWFSFFGSRFASRMHDALGRCCFHFGFLLRGYTGFRHVRAPARAPPPRLHREGMASTNRETKHQHLFHTMCVSHRTKVPQAQHDVKKFRSPCWVRRPPELPRDVCAWAALSAVSRALPLCHWPPPLRQRSWSETRPRREP